MSPSWPMLVMQEIYFSNNVLILLPSRSMIFIDCFPPYFWSAWIKIIFVPSSTTEADVSSQEVSIPRMSKVIVINYVRKQRRLPGEKSQTMRLPTLYSA